MLSYSQALDVLNSLSEEKPDQVFNRTYLLDSLARVRRFLDLLGNPQNGLKLIHVAGSKGKGSVCLMLSAMITELGYKVGLYTSPHLISVRERIWINSQEITEERFAFYVQKIINSIGLQTLKELTYFEFLTVLALVSFAGEELDYAVLEVGLGGRFDATNVVLPLASVLTSVELEHTAVLGDTLDKIGLEKLGIVKAGVPLFVGNVPDTVLKLAEKICFEQGSQFFPVFQNESSRLFEDTFLLSLRGRHQLENACLALQVMRYLFRQENCGRYTPGLSKISSLSRFHCIEFQNCEVVFDSAHTVESTKAFLTTFREVFQSRPQVIVFSIMKDKAVQEILDLIRNSKPQQIVFTSVDSKRALEVDVLQAEFGSTKGSHVPVFCEKSSVKAFEMALDLARPSGAVVCVIGSNYLIGEVMKKFGDKF